MPLSEDTRQKALNAYDYKCAFCEMSEEEHQEQEGRSLDIHHIVPRRAGGSNDVENLIPVCRSCHRTLETTQGDALERIESERSGAKDRIEELKRENRELESKYEEAQEMLEDERELHTDSLSAIDELVKRAITNTVYVVHEGGLTQSNLLYAGTDEDKACEKFKNADNKAKIETVKIRDDEWVMSLTDNDMELIGRNGCEIVRDRLKDHQKRIEHESQGGESNE